VQGCRSAGASLEASVPPREADSTCEAGNGETATLCRASTEPGEPIQERHRRR
jgi:hypothetical protein